MRKTDLLSHSSTKEIGIFQYVKAEAPHCSAGKYNHFKNYIQEFSLAVGTRHARNHPVCSEAGDGAGLDADHCSSTVTSLFNDCFTGTRDTLKGKRKAEPWQNHLHCGFLMKRRTLLREKLVRPET